MFDEPDHDALCEREQRFLLRAIDEDLDLATADSASSIDLGHGDLSRLTHGRAELAGRPGQRDDDADADRPFSLCKAYT